MAHQSASPAADNDADSTALLSLAEMLSKLSPSNLHLVENIIRVIVDEQARDSDRVF
jgi:predicted transcriptional regulator